MINPTPTSLKIVEAATSAVACRLPHCPGQYIIADDGGVYYDPTNSVSINQRINLSHLGGTVVDTTSYTITSDTPPGLYIVTNNCNLEVVGIRLALSQAEPLCERLPYSVAKGGCFFVNKLYMPDGDEMTVSIPYGTYTDISWVSGSEEDVSRVIDASVGVTYFIVFDRKNAGLKIKVIRGDGSSSNVSSGLTDIGTVSSNDQLNVWDYCQTGAYKFNCNATIESTFARGQEVIMLVNLSSGNPQDKAYQYMISNNMMVIKEINVDIDSQVVGNVESVNCKQLSSDSDNLLAFHAVATSGDYNDLENTPDIENIVQSYVDDAILNGAW